MDVFVYLLIWIGLSTWAISLVHRNVKGFGLRLALFLICVFVPLVGAGIASAIAVSSVRMKPTDSSDRMFDAVVDARGRSSRTANQ